MDPIRAMAKLAPKSITPHATGGGGIPALTPQDIAHALACIELAHPGLPGPSLIMRVKYAGQMACRPQLEQVLLRWIVWQAQRQRWPAVPDMGGIFQRLVRLALWRAGCATDAELGRVGAMSGRDADLDQVRQFAHDRRLTLPARATLAGLADGTDLAGRAGACARCTCAGASCCPRWQAVMAFADLKLRQQHAARAAPSAPAPRLLAAMLSHCLDCGGRGECQDGDGPARTCPACHGAGVAPLRDAVMAQAVQVSEAAWQAVWAARFDRIHQQLGTWEGLAWHVLRQRTALDEPD